MSRSGWAPGQLGHDVEHNELHEEIVGLSLVTTNTRTASYTLVITDAAVLIEFTSATPVTLTVPTATNVAFPVGTIVGISQYGAGQVTVVGQTGVTIRSLEGTKTAGQYAEASLRKRGVNEWVLIGGVTV